MPNLVCRKCKGIGKVTEEKKYRYKKIITIECPHCSKNWFISASPSWTYEKELMIMQSVTVHEDEQPEIIETAMSIAIKKALGESNFS